MIIQKFVNFTNQQLGLGTGYNLYTISSGGICAKDCGYTINEDFYLTFVYSKYEIEKSKVYKEKYSNVYENATGNFDEYMDKMFLKGETVDKVLYYINGKLYGYSYNGEQSYEEGLQTWNNDDCPFFLGVCPWYYNGNTYFMKGKAYTTRLYTTTMTPDQVKDNYDTTLKYRSSF